MQRYGKSAEIQNNSRFISFSADNILSLHSFISMKMVADMKKLLFVLSLFFLSLTIQAQVDSYWRLYPKIGFTLAKFPNDKFYSGDRELSDYTARYKQGMTGGLEIAYEHGVASFMAGVMYSNRGTKYNDYTYEDAGLIEKVSGIQYTLHYLEIPLMTGYEIMEGLKIKAGIQPGFLLKAKFMQSKITSEKQKDGQAKVIATEETDRDASDMFKKFDFSIPVGISYEFSNVVIDARYVFGVTENSDLIKARNGGFTFTVGYGLDL